MAGRVIPRSSHLIYTHRYNWRAEEAALNNELVMFTRDMPIDGYGALNVHYVHQKSIVAGAIPLLFVHGCMLPTILTCGRTDHPCTAGPGSFIEVRKILPMLVAPWMDRAANRPLNILMDLHEDETANQMAYRIHPIFRAV